MGTWMHAHGTKFEKKKKKQFFQGTITWSVLKKKKNFHAKNVYCRERVHLCLDHVDNPAFK